MFRYTKEFVMAVLMIVLFLSAASVAHADTVLALQVDSGPVTIVATGPSLADLGFSGAYGGFQVTFLGTTEENDATLSSILSDTTKVTNNSGQTHTLSLYVSSQDFTLPVGPALLVNSGEGGTYGLGVGAATFQAFADKNNTLLGTADFTNGLQVAVPPSGTANTFDTGDVTTTFVRNPGPYSLTTVSHITLTAGGTANYSNHEVLRPVECQAALGDFVWNDLNHDGIQDSGEPGIAGITVQLWNSNHTTMLASTMTDSAGLYHFTGLCAGTYQVEVPSQSGLTGYSVSPIFVGGNPDVDSNGNPFTVILPDQTTDNSIDFGYYLPNPHLTIVKTPDGGTFTEGSEVEFQIVVTNDGGSTANNVHVSDTLPGNGFLEWIFVDTTQGSCTLVSNQLECSLGSIAAGASATIKVKSASTTPLTACQVQNNPAAVATGDNVPTVQDSGSLTCTPEIHPATTLTTSNSSITSTSGDPVTLTVTEKNTGDSPITNVYVDGTGCTTWLPASFPSLAVGASTDFTCTFSPVATTNWTATGHGTDANNHPVPTTNETTGGTVTVVHPSTTLTTESVTPGETVEAGTSVTITVKETNTGDSTISNISVSGTGCSPWTGGATTLSAGASTTFSCTFVANATTAWTADASGTDAAGHTAPANGESTNGVVKVIKPATTLTTSTVTPGTTVHPGTSVTITVTETNTGDDAITNVSVTGTGCATWLPASVANLAPGASADFTCTFTVNATTNWSATGHGTDSLGQPVPDAGETTSGTVTVIKSATTLTTSTVTPGTTVYAGTSVTITVTETNTGDDAITNVSVTGTGCATWLPASVANLAPGASTNFTCTFTANATTNWSATGHGTDSLGQPVPDAGETTSGKVTVIKPATTLITKTVNPSATVNAGTPVTITVTETNSGDSNITNVTVTGTGCATWLPASVGNLAPGASADFSCTFTPIATTAWSATGHGTDVLGHPVPLTNETTGGTVTVVYPPPTASCIVINAVQNVPITPVTMTGSGGAGGPYTFTATGLPLGITMSLGGTISGTPSVTGTFDYTVTIKDVLGNIGTVKCTLKVNPPPPPCVESEFIFTGNTSTSGTTGNIRTFTVNGVSVNASAFSRKTTDGSWSTAYLGLYGPGLGVTDNTEGTGVNPTHKVDNIGGTVNYVMFEFSAPVTVDRVFLDAIGPDSDMSVWIGTKTNPFVNHQATLSDAYLTGLGFTETNETALTTTSRWADINSGSLSGNVLIIAALASDTSPEDEFKISKLDISCAPPPPTCSGTIGDFVWKDLDGDGIQDLGEPGISGVTLQLKKGATVVGTTSTNADGYYQFTGLCAATYTVTVLTPPSGYNPSPSLAGSNRSVDSNVNPTTITLPANDSSDQTIDFGFVPGAPPPCVGRTFTFTGDTPSSGTAGNTQTLTVNGVSVKASAFSKTTTGTWSTAYLGMYGPGLGVTDNSEGTGAAPKHKVDNIGQINYVLFEFSSPVVVNRVFLDAIGADSDISVWIGTKTDPYNNHQTLSNAFLSSLSFTEENLTAATVTSRWADINSGNVSGNILVVAALATDTSAEDEFKISKLDTACLTPPPICTGTIGDFVWKDIDGDGIQESGELGISGVTVQLKSGATVIATTTTNSNGYYQFTGLCAGSYSVVIPTIPSGHTASPSGVGSNKAIDSNGSPATVTLTANNSVDQTIDFGFKPTAPPACVQSTFTFTGNSASSGTKGNIRTFTVNGITVKASAFSRTSSGAWDTAWLGLYGPGMGVTDTSEGDGSNNRHKVDNIDGRNNYVLFEFSAPVVINQAFLDAIGADSDITVWIGSKTDPINNHITLSDSLLTSLGYTEENSTAAVVTSRWADVNSGNRAGNVFVLSALASDTSPEDEFKISKLDVRCQ